tara:strand:- start:1449 stop:1886 length:438 start_codon:yes stop_codon:yes gene_type:complete
MLSNQIFMTVVDSTPLVSIDILLKRDHKILLGRRLNKPAQGYFFSIGGRIHKNETIDNAIARVALEELNIYLKSTPDFIGVFEHFYDNSMYSNVSTHYVNLAYEYEVDEIPNLPTQQHTEYQWFSINGLLESKEVHKYTKDYFRN